MSAWRAGRLPPPSTRLGEDTSFARAHGRRLVAIVAVVATPDPLGLNGGIIAFLLFIWVLGLAAGAGITAMIRALRQRNS
jgi:hypothetical protein